MKFKRIFITLTALLILSQLASCGFHRGHRKEYKTPSRQAAELQTKIMDCFVNKDRETLKGFFSKYTMEQCPEIEEQIEEAFTFLDGSIVSYDEPDGDAAGSYDDKSYGADTDHILTERGTEYWITFNGRLTSLRDENQVGVLYIKVVNVTEYRQHEDKDRDDYVVYIGTGY